MTKQYATVNPHRLFPPGVADELFYSVAEAALVLGVSPSTVWRWIDAGKLPAYRVGPKSIRIRRADLAAVVHPVREQKEVTPMATERPAFAPPSEEELTRRQALVRQILALREQAVIT